MYIKLCSVIVLATVACGCAQREHITVSNETDSFLKIDVAFPWPGYAFAAPGGHQFSFSLKPRHTWDSSSHVKEDRSALPLRMPNGILLLRIARNMGDECAVFTVKPDGPLREFDPLTIAVVNEGQKLWIQAIDRNGDPMPIEHADSLFWFSK